MVHITVWGEKGVESRITATYSKLVEFLDSYAPEDVDCIKVEGYIDPRVFIDRDDKRFIVKMTSKQFDKLRPKLVELNGGELERVY